MLARMRRNINIEKDFRFDAATSSDSGEEDK